MEANDNHSEEHTVTEFIEFCVNGRTSKSRVSQLRSFVGGTDLYGESLRVVSTRR